MLMICARHLQRQETISMLFRVEWSNNAPDATLFNIVLDSSLACDALRELVHHGGIVRRIV